MSQERETLHINEGTTVRLYAVCAILATLCALIMWLASIDAKASAAVKDVDDQKPVIIDLIKVTAELKTEVYLLREELKQQRGKRD